MTAQIDIPNGYRKDAKGNLVPVDRIKPVDQLRDDLVLALVKRGASLSKSLADFKAAAFSEIDTFVEQSAAEYGAKHGGKKGNISLLSFDGRYKILVAIQDSITFDERLVAAKALIDECLKDWTADARSEVATIVQDVFRVDKAGNIRPAQVLSLRRLDIADKRWLRAMDAISDAVQVTGSKSYIRMYERVGQTDQYKPISLDIAGV
ncbi:DUF3164 family protein [Halopseudomonas phragmitis]|uniref:Sulfate transporter n=1 Tax=Halopseudomonas phragmitis TaxID=1931241 RepID=A0A1V0B6G0_9GAMM|nr:DUF3164 family protein [Halopseudomonas phragmitis]AQZ95533.1 sulfate transporter [Halopseudomonas phragmitis]